MLGDADQALALLERAHATHRGADELEAALRCAIWIGLHSAQRGEIARAGGWLARAERLLEQLGGERAERGYLLLPGVFELEARGELEAAAATAGEAAAIAQRFGDRDLFGLAAHTQGHILIEAGRTSEGLGLLDETMLAAATGELSPIVTGIVYCGVILACQAALEVRRAREWTTVLSEWCERQPDLVAFSGRCLIHRAEIMELEGDWERALAEARGAERRSARGANTEAVAEARYRQGELHRLRGERAEAEPRLPRRQPGRARASARALVAAIGGGEARGGAGGDHAGARGSVGPGRAAAPAARGDRDHPYGRRGRLRPGACRRPAPARRR